MKQVWITKSGSPEVIEVREARDPIPGTGEVRIRVEAAGLNFADILARQGIYPDAPKLPAVLGYEVAGTVDALGEGVDDLTVGMPVLSMTRFGGHSSMVCVPRRQVFVRPDNMTAEEGAALPVTYLTTFQAVVVMGGIRHADEIGRPVSVLVHAAAGGVGCSAVDLGRYYGAQMLGTSSPGKHDFARERGYDALIDYTRSNWTEEVLSLTDGKGVDLVLDPLGGRSWAQSLKLLRPGGRLVVYGIAEASGKGKLGLLRTALNVPWSGLTPFTLMNKNRGILGVNMGRLWKEGEEIARWMNRLLELYREGFVRPYVGRRFAFEQAAESHEYLESRKSVGKVVLVP